MEVEGEKMNLSLAAILLAVVSTATKYSTLCSVYPRVVLQEHARFPSELKTITRETLLKKRLRAERGNSFTVG